MLTLHLSSPMGFKLIDVLAEPHFLHYTIKISLSFKVDLEISDILGKIIVEWLLICLKTKKKIQSDCAIKFCEVRNENCIFLYSQFLNQEIEEFQEHIRCHDTFKFVITSRKDTLPLLQKEGFPDSSVGKESACNAGDRGSIPGLGRSPEEGKRYPLHYSGLENSMFCIVPGLQRVGHG